MRSALAVHVPALVDMLVDRAMAGDVGAARLLLERTIAPLKASEEAATLTLPDGTLTEQGRAVLMAVAAGDLAPCSQPTGETAARRQRHIARLALPSDLSRPDRERGGQEGAMAGGNESGPEIDSGARHAQLPDE